MTNTISTTNGQRVLLDPEAVYGKDKLAQIFTKIEAFKSNDVDALIKAYRNSAGSPWYRFLNNDTVRRNVNAIQSDLLNKLVYTRADIIWKGVQTNDPDFTPKFLNDLEVHLALYGDVVVRLDYIDSTLQIRYLNSTQYEMTKDNFGRVESLVIPEYYQSEYKGQLRNFKLETLVIGNLHFMHLFVQEGDSWVEVALDAIPETKDLAPVLEMPHEMFHYFTTNWKIPAILETINAVDEAHSQMNHLLRVGAPIRYVPQEVIGQAGEAKTPEQMNLAESELASQYAGQIKVEYLDADYQKVDVIQPKMDIEYYQKMITLQTTSACETMGISAASLGQMNISPNASAQAIQEREKLSLRTRANILAERQDQLYEMWAAIGLDIELNIPEVEEDRIMEKGNYHKLLVDNLFESRHTAIRKLHPEWDDTQVVIELTRILNEVNGDSIGE